MNYYIKELEYYLPEKVIDNDFLEQECGIDKKFTEEKVGIKERRIALPNESVTDMAQKACEKLIDTHGIDRESIGLLLVCTQNPDYTLPTTACVLQDRLKLKTSIIAFDINLGCSGFVYSLPIAGNFIKNGTIDNAIIVMVDQYSKRIDYKDKNTASLFGDAATAVLLSKTENDDEGVLDVVFGTDGSGWFKLIANNSGLTKNDEANNYIFMDGKEIFKFSMMTVPKAIDSILNRNNLTMADFKYVILHQANQYMLKELQKRLKVPDEQYVIDMEFVGNTVQSTIPIALKNLITKGKLQKGDKILLTGFGVGLSWASAIYKYV